MNRKQAIFPLAAAVLALGVRVWDAAANIDAKTGFYIAGHSWLNAAVLVLLAAAAVGLWRGAKGRVPAQSEEYPHSGAAFVLLLSAGLCAAYSALRTLWDIAVLHPLSHFLMNGTQLRALGFANGSFRLQALAALFGFAAAAWFVKAALPHAKRGEKGLYRAPGFALAPVLWYMLRAVAAFVGEPVNSHDTVKLVALASPLALAWIWFALAKYTSFQAKEDVTRALALSAFACAVCTLALALPDAVVSARAGLYAELVARLADGLSAAAALLLCGGILKTAKECPKTDVQPQVD